MEKCQLSQSCRETTTDNRFHPTNDLLSHSCSMGLNLTTTSPLHNSEANIPRRERCHATAVIGRDRPRTHVEDMIAPRHVLVHNSEPAPFFPQWQNRRNRQTNSNSWLSSGLFTMDACHIDLMPHRPTRCVDPLFAEHRSLDLHPQKQSRFVPYPPTFFLHTPSPTCCPLPESSIIAQYTTCGRSSEDKRLLAAICIPTTVFQQSTRGNLILHPLNVAYEG